MLFLLASMLLLAAYWCGRIVTIDGMRHAADPPKLILKRSVFLLILMSAAMANFQMGWDACRFAPAAGGFFQMLFTFVLFLDAFIIFDGIRENRRNK